MSESRRNRRKNERKKHQPKSNITKKDKIIAFAKPNQPERNPFVIVLIFVIAAIAAVYYSLHKSGLTLL